MKRWAWLVHLCGAMGLLLTILVSVKIMQLDDMYFASKMLIGLVLTGGVGVMLHGWLEFFDYHTDYRYAKR